MRQLSFLVVVSLSGLLGACVAPAPPELPAPPPPLRPRILIDEPMLPAEKPQVRITDIKDALSEDESEFIVTGVLVNEGSGATSSIVVQVEGRDKDGLVIDTTEGFVSTQVIEAQGTATFTSRLRRRSDIVSYHVEAAVK